MKINQLKLYFLDCRQDNPIFTYNNVASMIAAMKTEL